MATSQDGGGYTPLVVLGGRTTSQNLFSASADITTCVPREVPFISFYTFGTSLTYHSSMIFNDAISVSGVGNMYFSKVLATVFDEIKKPSQSSTMTQAVIFIQTKLTSDDSNSGHMLFVNYNPMWPGRVYWFPVGGFMYPPKMGLVKLREI